MIEFDLLKATLLNATIPGAFGGLMSTVLSKRLGRKMPERQWTRFAEDIFGGAVTATFIANPLSSKMDSMTWCFFLGLCWNSILERTRSTFAAVVDAGLKGKDGKEQGK